MRTGWVRDIARGQSASSSLSSFSALDGRRLSGDSPNGYRRTDTVQFTSVDNKWQAERTSFATSLGSPLGRRPDLTAYDMIHDVVLTFYALRRGNIAV